jgi:uncharacterized protein YbjT (DUF2867 family)
MKIVLTGSLGHIGKPLTEDLVQKGHAVTVISSKADRKANIEALGAISAIGSVEDADFLAATFTGKDAVYTMVPPANYMDPNFDLMSHCCQLANIYVKAIQQSGIKRVVHLSSIGAHMEKGSGLILAHRQVEDIFNDKLQGVDITFMRPVGFYYNLLGFILAIKSQGIISANYGADDNLVWVSPIDIADEIVAELEVPPVSRKVIYVASDELTGNETAAILGEAIGKPDLKWVLVSDEQRLSLLKSFGLNPSVAEGLIEMFSAQHNGTLMEDYYFNKPVLGKVKMVDFAKEFAIAFNQ